MPSTEWGLFSVLVGATIGVVLMIARISLDRRRGTVRPRAYVEAALGTFVGLVLVALLISRAGM